MLRWHSVNLKQVVRLITEQHGFERQWRLLETEKEVPQMMPTMQDHLLTNRSCCNERERISVDVSALIDAREERRMAGAFSHRHDTHHGQEKQHARVEFHSMRDF